MCPVIGIPNQKVCPIGKVLCADLSCRDNYNLCQVFEPCEGSKKRCPDQSCHKNPYHCPRTINCGNLSKYVSNDDKCVDSELECKESKICDSDEKTYLCDGNTCAESWEECPIKKSCKSRKSLCEGNTCKNNCP